MRAFSVPAADMGREWRRHGAVESFIWKVNPKGRRHAFHRPMTPPAASRRLRDNVVDDLWDRAGAALALLPAKASLALAAP